MKGYLRILMILVAAAPLALLGCEKSPKPDPNYVDPAANPSALQEAPENPADAGPAAAEEPGE